MNIGTGRIGPIVACALLLTISTAAGAADTAALEKRLKTLEDELAALRTELAAVKSSEPAQQQQLQQIEGRVSAVETSAKEPATNVETRVAKLEDWSRTQPPRVAGNMVFFRGGYTSISDGRANGAFTDMNGISNALGVSPTNGADHGWFTGAGFDFLLSHDTWGLAPGTWALAELNVEYRKFNSERTLLTGPVAECLILGGGVGTCGALVGDENLLMLTVSASPKIKFMEGSKLRPWIIPVGLDFHVISPPSDSTNYLDVGAQFAAGVEYELIPGIKLGTDFRYHLAAGLTSPDYNLSAAQRAALAGLGIAVNDDANNDTWSVGGYLGIGF